MMWNSVHRGGGSDPSGWMLRRLGTGSRRLQG